MKKIILGLILSSFVGIASAAPLCTNWGELSVCIPVTSVDVAYGYAFLKSPATGKQTSESQALVETPILIYKQINLDFLAASGQYFSLAPGLDLTYNIPNPITNSQNILSQLKPGLYGGNFNLQRSGWFGGVKASLNVFGTN